MSQIQADALKEQCTNGQMASEMASCNDAAADSGATTSTVVKPRISPYRRHLLVCVGPRCTQDGQSQALYDSLGERFKAAGLQEGELRVKRSRVSCFAACKGGPIVCVQPDGVWYYNVTPANMDRIIDTHLVQGRMVQDLVFHQGPDGACAADAP